LNPRELVLVDLPDKEERVRGWLADLDGPVELMVGNIMYDEKVVALEPFDVLWCTGVLYHNPEQLRMVRQLYDFVAPGGVLVIESATARRGVLRDENCVEIWHDVSKATRRRFHVSTNITHLPSRRAIQSWLKMVGFDNISLSDCHRRVTRGLAADRAAFIARRPKEGLVGTYYTRVGLNYEIGKAL
jgi:SAM-dependent methyltransferase